MKPIGLDEIQKLSSAKQYFQDCYLLSSVSALAKSSNGKKILAQNIARTNEGYRVRFNNIVDNGEDFFITEKEMDNLIYLDKYMNPDPVQFFTPHNPVIKAIEVAMNKLLKKYPLKKPLICRIPDCHERFEFNKPSNFWEMFTGKKPINVNEDGFRFSLKSKADECVELFDKMGENPDNSFVVGTSISLHKRLANFHCYRVENVDKSDNSIEIFDHRHQKTLKLSYDEAIKYLKYIVGYFNSDLI